MHVDVIQTPNPNALKFVPGGDVTGSLRSVAVRCRPPPTPAAAAFPRAARRAAPAVSCERRNPVQLTQPLAARLT